MTEWKKRLRPTGSLLRGFIPRQRNSTGTEKQILENDKFKIYLVLALTFLILLILFTPDILLQGYQWNVGEAPPRDIIAPFSFSVENREETERLRKAAENAAPIVFQFNRLIDTKILLEIESVFSTAHSIASDEKLQQSDKIKMLDDKIGFPISHKSVETLLRYPQYLQLRQSVQSIGRALDTTLILTDESYAMATDVANLEVWSEETQQMVSWKQFVSQHGNVVSVTQFETQIEKISSKYLPQKEDAPVRVLVKELFDHLLQPNLVIDAQRTNDEKVRYRNQIRLVRRTIKRGDVIIPALQTITPEPKEILDELTHNRLKYGLSIVFGRAVVLLLFGYFTGLYLRRYYPKYTEDFNNLAPVCTLTVIIVGLTKLTLWLGGSEYLIPFASFAMLAGILFEIRFALLMTTEVAVLFGVMLGLEVKYVLIFLAAGTVASFSVAHIVRRTDLVKSGLRVSLVNVLGIGALFLYDHPFFSTFTGKWMGLGMDILAGAGNGLLCYGITLVILPLFEWMFNLTTDVKLLEYSDPHGPGLAKLEQEAPGTYQHSLNVGQFAESAALAVGANALLSRIGGYYQDIGKIVTPEYFTENHLTDDDRKRHDKLTPHMSCLIIKNHVKYGLEMAAEYHLPPPVVDIIAQHHGTTLIGYFYYKALEMKGENEDSEEINEIDYRYPGPKPQTAEAAIVMLADSVEAAVASIPNPTAGAIQTMVRKVVNDKFTDEQLDECDITLRDLHLITESLVRTLLSKFHRRIEYPELEEAEQRGDNGY
jgi:cyclic-di-AMP phosphodiesterase PgpH